MLQKWKHYAVTTTTTSALRLPAVLQASRAYKKDAAAAVSSRASPQLAPVPVYNFRYYQYSTDFGENKEVKVG